jgi:hypothetical protein
VRAGRLRWFVGIAVLCLLGGAAVFFLVDAGPQRAELAPRPGVGASADEDGAAAAWLSQTRTALVGGDREALGELADGSSGAQQLAAIAANLEDLRVDGLALRYVDSSDVELSADQRREYGEDAWVADVELSWRFAGVDRSTSTVEVPLVLTWADGRAVFAGTEPFEGYRVPLWLVERVSVRRTDDVLVLGPDRAQVRALERKAQVAMRTVRRTLPDWDGPLVVQAPASEEQFAAAAGMSAEAAAAIAAVTTTTDGSGLPQSSVHIFLNPPVFEPLGPRGQQIVVSHEAAHVALDAVTKPIPLWLSEGIADYIALVDSPLDTSVLAAQIRALVKREGVPDALPGRAEFEGSNEDIGAWYEAAWLAVRLIADTHGEEALLAFYAAAEGGTEADPAFREVLGTTEQQFVRDWQDYLADLAA